MPTLPGLTFHSTCVADLDQLRPARVYPGWTPLKQYCEQMEGFYYMLTLRYNVLIMLQQESLGMAPTVGIPRGAREYLESARRYFSTLKGSALRHAIRELLIEMRFFASDCQIRFDIGRHPFHPETGTPLTNTQGQSSVGVILVPVAYFTMDT